MSTKQPLLQPAHGKKVVIAGGGPCGAIAGCFLSNKGYKVDIYENRADIRLDKNAGGRSINLSLSERGRAALRAVGLEQEILDIGVKMSARMIHQNTASGDCFPIPYGNKPEHYLLSVNRLLLNKKLLTLAEKFENVDIHFQEKVLGCDFKNGHLLTENKKTGENSKSYGDLIIGADGLWSSVRKSMMRSTPTNFSQTYIPHMYKELIMASDGPGKFRMEKNYLHIWPRGEFMMIGLANLDGSFTMTLFMPHDKFKEITDPDSVMKFFKAYFPDSIPLFGEEYLRTKYFEWEPLPLSYIKVDPYFYGDNCVLVGDAAHAIVPFYGQGLNAGLQSVQLLCNKIEENKGNIHNRPKWPTNRN